ncbi:Crp/Fnr family transcriptional regulator [Roseivirga sp. BDSF3-8]|uniref:Crp/Fnr family transcriptional regulator n=1 Tax=Roseivirga sp. BDSF3-8 TaxID=3241598 RepID=UPI003532280B
MTIPANTKSLLRHLGTIQSLSETEEEAIAALCEVVKVGKNEDLQHIGQTCRTIYFVQEGAARIYYYKEGRDVTEYFAFAHDMIIRAESLFTGQASQKAIQAVTDTAFVAIPAGPLYALFDVHHSIERLFRKMVERSYVEALHRLEDLQFSTAEERYRSLLEKSPEVVQTIPLKHVASYLGITQVSLSRIRSSLA